MKYYEVVAKCGHVGNGKYIDVSFPVKAETASDAAQLILKHSKVKKHLKNAITNVFEIDYERFVELVDNNSNDKYLRSHFKKEVDLSSYEILSIDYKTEKRKVEFEDRKEMIAYKLRKAKILKEAFNYEYVY